MRRVIDTAQAVAIDASNWKIAALLMLGAGIVAFGLGLLWRGMMIAPSYGIAWIILVALFGAGVIFAGASMMETARRLFIIRHGVITLSPEGIRDRRIGETFVPWQMVRQVVHLRTGGAGAAHYWLVGLDLDPAVADMLPGGLPRRILRRMRNPDRLRLAIRPEGLAISYRRLYRLCEAYAATTPKAVTYRAPEA